MISQSMEVESDKIRTSSLAAIEFQHVVDVLLTYRKELAQFANYATQARAKEYQPEEANVY